MRIVDVCAFYTPHGGGVRTYVERKLKAAAEAGHEMIVLAPGREDRVVERTPGAVLATIAAPVLPFDRRYRYFGDETSLHAALDAWKPDVVEASSPWSSASMVARWQGAAPRTLIMHADPLAAYAYRWFGGVASIPVIDRGFDWFWQHLRRLGEQFDYVISANENLSARLREGGVAHTLTNPMGVEPGVFSPEHRDPALRARLLGQLGLPESATLALGVGRYSPEKRWGMVIDAAMAAGSREALGLMLVGDGRRKRQLVARASGSPHIRVGGAVAGRAALATLMASADVLVHGCEAETFCMAAAEARASGLPVIVPDRGGAADHADSAASLRYAACDGVALRDTLLDFARHRPDGAAAPLDVRSINDHFDDLFALYASLCEPARRVA